LTRINRIRKILGRVENRWGILSATALNFRPDLQGQSALRGVCGGAGLGETGDLQNELASA
jgi:hypothetical protein